MSDEQIYAFVELAKRNIIAPDPVWTLMALKLKGGKTEEVVAWIAKKAMEKQEAQMRFYTVMETLKAPV